MEITKLEHSGIVIEKDGERIVFDPVEFNKTIPRLNNVVAVIITHKHSDHLQIEIIKRIIRDNSDAKIITTSDTASFIEDPIIVKGGESCEIGGFKLDFFGKDHAAIIPGQIPCENIGVVVNGSIVNPGDSFDYSDVGAKVLFVPISAPWLKIAESMDFVDRIKPKIVIPVHDALLSDLGKSISENWMKKACDKAGAEYKDLSFGENVVC